MVSLLGAGWVGDRPECRDSSWGHLGGLSEKSRPNAIDWAPRPYTPVMQRLEMAANGLSDEAVLAGVTHGDEEQLIALARRYQKTRRAC